MSNEENKSEFQAGLDALRAQRIAEKEANANKEAARQAAQEKFAKEGRPEAQNQFKQLKIDVLKEIKGNEDIVKENSPTFFDGRVFEVKVNDRFLVAIAFEPSEAEIAVSHYLDSGRRQSFVPSARRPEIGEDARGQLFYNLAWSERHSGWRWQRLNKKYPSRVLVGNVWDSLFAKEKNAGPTLSYEELLKNILDTILSLVQS